MKTTFKAARFATALAFLFCIVSFSSKAQIPGPGPFDIINNTNCALTIRWSVIGNSGVSCIASPGFVTLPANGMITISAAMISGSCGGSTTNIFIGVTGTTTGPAFSMYYGMDSTTAPFNATETDCFGVSYTYSFSYNGNNITIN